jgi:oligopeptide/dipeptide ABC transporter ATP-binding protein
MASVTPWTRTNVAADDGVGITMTPQEDPARVLAVRGLATEFRSRTGIVRAVDRVDLDVRAGEIVGLVGESGSGKSITAYSILGLVPEPGSVVEGEVWFQGHDLRKKSPHEMRRLRGAQISMIFQEPLSALNPLLRVRDQVGDVLRVHLGLSKEATRRRVRELLDHVGIPAPDHVADSYPFQLSGGMRQRVLIAMAIACRPALLIADEPSTSLDVTVQAQIMDLLRRLVEQDGVSVLLITHDIGVVAQMCDRVYVMYAGRMAEHGTSHELLLSPEHPYSSALLGCVPSAQRRGETLRSIEGVVPVAFAGDAGCRFADRCGYAQDRCRVEVPPLTEVSPTHAAACHFVGHLSMPGLSIHSTSRGST